MNFDKVRGIELPNGRFVNRVVRASDNMILWRRGYSVKFYDKEGKTQIGETQTVLYGGDAKPPTPPSRSGEQFSAWTPDYHNITADTSCYATYDLLTYVVSYFDKDDPNVTLSTEVFKYEESREQFLNGNVIVKSHKTFQGWDKSPSEVFPIRQKWNILGTYANNMLYSLEGQSQFKFDGKDHVFSCDYKLVPDNISQTTKDSVLVQYSKNGTKWQQKPFVFHDIMESPETIYYKISALDVDTVNGSIDVFVGEGDIFDLSFYFIENDDWVVGVEKIMCGLNSNDPYREDAIEGVISSEFTGWDKPDKLKDIQNNGSVSAQYTIRKFLVKYYTDQFDIHPLSLLREEYVEYGKSGTYPKGPDREGWRNFSWKNKSGTNINNLLSSVTSNIEAYQDLKKIVYLSVYTKVGENDEELYNGYELLSGQSIEKYRINIPQTLLNGTFNHWNPEEWNPINEDTDICAVYDPLWINVVYHDNVPLEVTYYQGY